LVQGRQLWGRSETLTSGQLAADYRGTVGKRLEVFQYHHQFISFIFADVGG
jgi:hypothetical protein